MRTLFTVSITLIFSLNIISQTINGTYSIKNVESGKLLRPKNANKQDETPIVLYAPTNWKCLTWDFKNIEDETYQLKNLFTNKTFISLNNELKQTPLSEGDKNQHWVFEKENNNQYRIRLKDSNLYITPSDKNGTTNSIVILSKKINSDIQLWTIYEQHPTH